jgi:hypothetical protein
MRLRIRQLWLSANRDAIHHATASYASWPNADTVRQPDATDSDAAGCAFPDAADQPDVCADDSTDVCRRPDSYSV